VEEVVGRSLLTGNAVTPLVNGEAAFPAMLEAIEQAQKSVSLSTYIFDRDPLGKRFVAALAAAAKRDVEVRVLIDAAGSRYSLPSVVGLLRRNGVRVARFLPSAPWRLRYLNLRLHRKVLVVDGRIGFTGGMNLRAGHLVEASKPRRAIRDVQFRIEGPVVARLQENFVTDWAFTTKEQLRGETWFPDLEPRGTVIARGIPDGPDEDIDKVGWTILAALSAARQSVRVVTPYFLPDQPLVSALNLAALRGVEVDILLPKRNNLPYVNWAAFGLLWQVLGHGCRVWLTQPPFDHTKLMIVDDTWVLLGSANWDPRSLRLNFEYNVECYSTELAEAVEDLVEARLETAESVTRERLAQRSLPVKLRDGVARLLKPYL
jgi:cardiolipin synthase